MTRRKREIIGLILPIVGPLSYVLRCHHPRLANAPTLLARANEVIEGQPEITPHN